MALSKPPLIDVPIALGYPAQIHGNALIHIYESRNLVRNWDDSIIKVALCSFYVQFGFVSSRALIT